MDGLSARLRRIRRGWNRVRPLPLPRYPAATPRLDDGLPPKVYQIPNPLTLAEAALSQEAHRFVVDLIDRLRSSEETHGQQAFYRLCEAQFGAYWRYADLTTVLWAAAKLIQPNSYLEIGVLRGRSTAVVAALRPECAIYGFDLWRGPYGGVASVGPDFVREELRSVGHVGSVTLVAGDSRETVPAFLLDHANLYFDLINVDGDHSVLGAASDLANVLPHLKVGGIIVFDDLNMAPALRRVWDKLVRRDGRYLTWEFTDAGYGVGAGIRVSDKPRAETLRYR